MTQWPFFDMTTSALIQLFKDTLKGDLLSDQYQEAGTDAVVVDALNNAMAQMSIWCEFNKPNIPVSVVYPNYQMTLKALNATNLVRKVNEVVNPLLQQRFKVKPVSQLNYDFPYWGTATQAGSPLGVWQSGGNIIFYPAPTVAEVYYMDCECNAQELSAADLTREPELYGPIHNNIAYLAAAMVSERNAMTPAQKEIIAGIYQAAKSDCLDALHKDAVQL